MSGFSPALERVFEDFYTLQKDWEETRMKVAACRSQPGLEEEELKRLSAHRAAAFARLQAELWAVLGSSELEDQRRESRLLGELVHLAEDPNEDRDLVRDHPDEAARLLGRLRTWSDSMPVPVSAVVHSHRDMEHEANLGALGYGGDGEVGVGLDQPEAGSE